MGADPKMMEPIDVDDAKWPLLVVTFPFAYTNDELARCLEKVESLYARKERCAVVIDSMSGNAPTAIQRKMVNDHFERQMPYLGQHCCGLAVALKSTLTRGALTAIWWFHPPAYPHTVVASRAEALEWARTRLRDAKVA